MGLTNTKLMLNNAYKKGYAIGAFNFTNLEQLQAILEVSVQENSPVIVATSISAIKYMGLDVLVAMVKACTKNLKQSVALHLDHGTTFEHCKSVIDAGFTSVMIDASSLNFDDNVSLTKRVVDYARSFNVTVEAELGKLAGIEDDISSAFSKYTDPMDAKKFVELTGVDSLAVSIGTSHGAYKFSGKPSLQTELLAQIKKLLPNTPLVLHGASGISQELQDGFSKSGGSLSGAKGISDSLITKAIENGIAKINVDSDLRIALTTGVREALINKEEFNPRTYMSNGKNKMKEILTYKIKNIFNSKDKN
ncbi:MAG: class II fructose-bisphosphate aldolase family protein [Clostridia bacterium]|nr:class II fructose-bisphosphate aldolase family protein [Clostridia bacterium]